MRKILVLRGGALGNFIVTLPALLALRLRWPEAVIELVGNATAADLARSRGVLTRVHSQHDARWAALYRDGPVPDELGSWLSEFDLVVSCWPDPDGALGRHFPTRPRQEFVSVPAMPAQRPAARHYVAPLASFGVFAEHDWCVIGETSITFPSNDGMWHPTPAMRRTGRVAMHPGSGSARKNWPATRWLELIRQTEAPILLVLGEAESTAWTLRTLEESGLGPRLANGSVTTTGQVGLEELRNQLQAARLFVGHDSGVSHLAAACGVPSILLFGPTDPTIWAPPAPRVRVVKRGDSLAAIEVRDVQAEMAEVVRNV